MSKKKYDDLDTETTIADMNIDGFSWYDPNRKKERESGKKPQSVQLTSRERRAVMKGALLAVLPFVACVMLATLAVFGLAYLWLY